MPQKYDPAFTPYDSAFTPIESPVQQRLSEEEKKRIIRETIPQLPINEALQLMQDYIINPVKYGVNKGWETINTPLTEAPSRFADYLSQFVPEGGIPFGIAENQVEVLPRDISQSLVSGTGALASGLTSPLNLGLITATAGSGLAGRAGLEGTALGLNTIAKTLSVPVAAHGAYNVVDPSSTMTDRLLGLLETVGGGAGLLHDVRLPPRPVKIKGLLPEHSATAPPTYIASPEGKVTPFATATERDFAEVTNPTIRGPKGKFTRERQTYSGTGQPNYSQTSIPTSTARVVAGDIASSTIPKPNVPPVNITPEGKFVDQAGVEIVPPDEFLRIANGAPKRDLIREGYELARGTTAAWDISAPFRQGIGMVGTRNWFRAWVPMFEALGSERGYQTVLARIKELPHVASGLSTQARLPLTDITQFGGKLGPREEILSSKLAEKLPGIRASNRAYTAYLNHLRANTFNDWIDDAIAQGLNPNTNIALAQNIANVVGDLTGRGELKLDVGLPLSKVGNVRLGRTISLERHTGRLADIFFAPRLMASRIRMLNPSTYIMLDPLTRRKELEGLLRLGAWWISAAGLMKMAGADVSTDPTSADFGKVRIDEKTRMDVAGGYQQYLVLISKLITGKYTSTVTGQTKEFGSEYGAETRFSTTQRFFSNKLHPTLKFAVDLASATQNRPIQLGDRTFQMFAPMLAQDILKIANDNPKLLPWLTPAAATGMSTQIYDKGQSESLVVPEEYDIRFGGGKLLPD